MNLSTVANIALVLAEISTVGLLCAAAMNRVLGNTITDVRLFAATWIFQVALIAAIVIASASVTGYLTFPLTIMGTSVLNVWAAIAVVLSVASPIFLSALRKVDESIVFLAYSAAASTTQAASLARSRAFDPRFTEAGPLTRRIAVAVTLISCFHPFYGPVNPIPYPALNYLYGYISAWLFGMVFLIPYYHASLVLRFARTALGLLTVFVARGAVSVAGALLALYFLGKKGL